MYLKVNLTTLEVIHESLPHDLLGLLDESLIDLSWTAPELGYQGYGWWRIEHQPVEVPADSRMVGYQYAADRATSTILATPICEAFSEEELAAAKQAAEDAAVQRLIADARNAVQKRLDDFAATRGYGDSHTAPMLSLCTYATSTNPTFKAEGQYGVDSRDAHWAKCYEIMDAVVAKQRPIPTLEEVLAEMPELKWPV